MCISNGSIEEMRSQFHHPHQLSDELRNTLSERVGDDGNLPCSLIEVSLTRSGQMLKTYGESWEEFIGPPQ
jgi:hypothetical protein